MKKSLSTAVLLAGLGVAGCKHDRPEDTPPPTVYKENAYELNLLTKKLPDGSTVFQLNKTIYLKGQTSRRLILSLDTLPAIGRETATVVNVDDDGDEATQSVPVDKEYDVLFKVDTLDASHSFGFSWDSSSVKTNADSLHPTSTTSK